MIEVFQVLLATTGVFLASSLIAYGIGKARQTRIQSHTRTLRPTGAVLIKTSSGVYRARFDHAEPGVWVLDAPVQRDSYVPLREGEEVILDAPVAGGAVVFRSVVLERDAVTKQYRFKVPANLHATERREVRRQALQDECLINGMPGKMLNYSAEGALVLSGLKLKEGQVVHLKVGSQELTGTTLDSAYESFGTNLGGLTRVKFDVVNNR